MLTSDILDELALAALIAVTIDNVERSQVDRLLEILESTASINVLRAFIARQYGRGYWGNGVSAARLDKILAQLKSLDEAREVLSMFKWLYEAGSRSRYQLSQLRNQLGRSYRTPQNNPLNNPRINPPKDFFDTYLRSVLRR